MASLQFFRNDLIYFTHCRFKGHTVKREIVEQVKRDPNIEIETECEKCGWPVIVWQDPEDPDYYFVSEE